jgi:hypothetical protein
MVPAISSGCRARLQRMRVCRHLGNGSTAAEVGAYNEKSNTKLLLVSKQPRLFQLPLILQAKRAQEKEI